MNILIIGFGSIGQRHYEVLSTLKNIKSISIVTKQENLKLNGPLYKDLRMIKKLDLYDYFIISSETVRHFDQLLFLEENVQNKLIFCEKPLFEKFKTLKIKRNKVFVGYVLRYHPLIQELKRRLENEMVINTNITCGQYLPRWRNNQDYKKSYSASKKRGGGVLLDLSHEIDYLQWLFGKMNELKSYQSKISDLEIDSDDITIFIGKTENNTLVNLSIDYISKIDKRRIYVDCIDKSFELNLLLNTMIIKDKENKENEIQLGNLDRNYIFKKMHEDILLNNEYSCSYDCAKDVMATISTIQEQNR